jgi:hypothetical protein
MTEGGGGAKNSWGGGGGGATDSALSSYTYVVFSVTLSDGDFDIEV